VRTSGASAVFDDRIPEQDAVVARRLKDAGAILIGKTNLHEFAMGGTNATSYYVPVRNPWALDRNPGGSSGGSAAAVSAGLCFGALGTDTGGSIRIPAAFCGVVGLKTTLIPVRPSGIASDGLRVFKGRILAYGLGDGLDAREHSWRGRKWIRPNRRRNASAWDATARYRISKAYVRLHTPWSLLAVASLLFTDGKGRRKIYF
jgi:hypothetical protein